jgi:hypothetical protein
VSDERTDLQDERNGRSKLITRGIIWGLRPQAPGIYRVRANPSESSLPAGADFSPNSSLVLAPESALSLLPSRGLSSAPVACSVFAKGNFTQRCDETKSLTFAALSDMGDIRSTRYSEMARRTQPVPPLLLA